MQQIAEGISWNTPNEILISGFSQECEENAHTAKRFRFLSKAFRPKQQQSEQQEQTESEQEKM